MAGTKKEVSGVITVYLSLILLVMLSLILICAESVRVRAMEAMTGRYADMASEMVLASYVRPLARRYGILAYDRSKEGGEITYFQSCLERNLKVEGRFGNLQGEVISLTADSIVLLADQGWQPMMRQIRDCEFYKKGEQALTELLGLGADLNQSSVENKKDAYTSSLNQRGSAAAQEAETARSEEGSGESGVGTSGSGTNGSSTGGSNNSGATGTQIQTAEDPRAGVGSWLRTGLMELALSGKSVSDRSIDVSGCSYHIAATSALPNLTGFLNYRRVSGDVSDQTVVQSISEGLSKGEDDLLLTLYIMDHFDCFTHKVTEEGQESVLSYEAEYILFGKDTDRENLKRTVGSLVSLRTVLNLAYLYTDQEKTAPMDTMALAISGAGFPVAAQLVKLLLIACWSTAESVVDTAALLDGQKVPLMKSYSTWNLSSDALLAIGRGNSGTALSYVRQGDKGLSYEQYLMLLMMTRNRQARLVRASNIMECNIRLDQRYSDFMIKNCMTGASWSGKIKSGHHFYNIGTLEIPFTVTNNYVQNEN